MLALEYAYEEIRSLYSDGVEVKEYKGKPGVIGHIPEAVIIIGSSASKYGHFAHSKWNVRTEGKMLAEIMIGAEGLKREPRQVLATLIHEATHGVCHTAGVQDVSRGGKYHNKAFARTAENLGLVVSESANKQLGHSNTVLPDGELQWVIDEITPDLIAYRELDVAHAQSGTPKVRELNLKCSCIQDLGGKKIAGRTIRVFPGIYEMGPILCSVCGGEFE